MAASDVNIKDLVVGIFLVVLTIAATMFFFIKYSLHQQIIAWIMDRFTKFSNKKLSPFKQDLFYSMKKLKHKIGDDLFILEIGAGGGANFEFYPRGSKVTCLEPNKFCKKYIERNASDRIEMRGFIKGFAEDMREIEDCSYDVVVSTLVLCTVRDHQKVLSEIRRVLKHNGKFYFLDHVAAKKYSLIYFLQKLLNCMWKKFAGGCQLIHNVGNIVKQHGGFKTVDLQYFTWPIWIFPPVRPCCMGIATK